LAEILGEYFTNRTPSQLLFPGWRRLPDGTLQERRLTDLRGALAAVERWGGFTPGQITTKWFRHSYCSTRLQTLDRGQPVSVDVVRRELGHGDESLVRKIYGHLGDVRHRAEAVEYRVGQHLENLGDRLRSLWARANTTSDTTHPTSPTPPVPRGV
jgi:integrase